MALTILKAELREKALELGWKETLQVYPLFLASGKDLNAIHEHCVIESRSSELLAKAMERKGALLINPALCDDFPKNSFLAVMARDKGKRIEIPLHLLLDSRLTAKAKIIAQMRFFFSKALKTNLQMIASIRASDQLDCKSPEETMALLECIGFSKAQARSVVLL